MPHQGLNVARLHGVLHGRAVGMSVVSLNVFFSAFLTEPTRALLLGCMWPMGQHLNRPALNHCFNSHIISIVGTVEDCSADSDKKVPYVGICNLPSRLTTLSATY